GPTTDDEDRVSGEAMRAAESEVDRVSRRLTNWDDTAEPTTLAVAKGTAVAYCLAAQLGLAFIAQPSGVAVFWLASGLAVSFLIISDRRAYPAFVNRFMVSIIAANVLSERSLPTATFKGIKGA